MIASTLAFACYWSVPGLRRDLGILMYIGAIQRTAAEQGRDTPAGWFFGAAQSYAPCDDVGRLARFACQRVAMAFEDGAPS